jgi:CHASE1-domain containing sensor protein
MLSAVGQLEKWLYVISAIVLVAGLVVAALIYVSADDAQETAASYLIINGEAHAIPPGASKTHVRELQRFGGKAAVLFDELNRWFAGLWHGKSLAVTLAWISVVVSLALFLVARRIARQEPPRA